MSVKKEVKRLDKSNIELTVTVPKEDVASRYQEMLKDYLKDIQIPGFRKGKVPKEVFERKYAEALKQDALSHIVEASLREIFEDKDLPRSEKPLPYSVPELRDEPQLDFERDAVFSVVYDVLPEVKIGAWKGLKVEYPYAEVKKEDIDREIEGIRERNAIVMDRDDSAPAKKGDIVTIDYQIFDDDGSEPENLRRKDFAFTLGSNANIYQFDDDIVGMKKGESKTVDKKLPDDHADSFMAGKTRKTRVTLTSLKEKKLPDLDDDLAQDVDEKFKTLDDLKNSVTERLNSNLERRSREVKTSELLKKIMENTPVVLPESMINSEIEGRFRRLAKYYNTSAEAVSQAMAGNEERRKEWREAAEKALHSRMIIETLIEEQKFDITDDDTRKELERIASESGMDIEEVRKHYDDQGMLYLKEDIKEKRVIDTLLAENTLKPGKKENYLDFMTDNG